ncbi:rod-binding protein [Rhizobiaceae bacterium n13]|uniref:Rod-binding protein n=1 Tax=Ferirhizobium litorale TaxID=2927786 RepID=A0AAE3QFC1_9HYPH|nr:rod-binding protein [Fererhizobium litorale]MDI7863427.1 rod-binding protein [Fererhizobium litorale]MDI7922296.1 rod-binding protein [Fererhizobium litorale]
MAISPPSDLVLDVVRAADPADVQAAQAKLKANRAAFAATSLADKGAGFEAAIERISTPATDAGLGNLHAREKSSEIPETFKQFEAVVLQNFVKTMLPSDSEEIYGKGSAGEIWKSMLAEQVGQVMSKSGGIGIAAQMFAEQLSRARDKGTNASADGNDRNLATSMITEFERRVLGVNTDNENKTDKS